MPLRPRQVLLCLVLILPTAPIWAKPDVATLAAVELALSLPADPGALLALAQDLADRLPEVTPSAASARPSAPGAVRVEVGQMQAALTQLSIPDGTNGHLALQLAQDGRTDVIYLLSGDATLADLQSGGAQRHRQRHIRQRRGRDRSSGPDRAGRDPSVGQRPAPQSRRPARGGFGGSPTQRQ